MRTPPEYSSISAGTSAPSSPAMARPRTVTKTSSASITASRSTVRGEGLIGEALPSVAG